MNFVDLFVAVVLITPLIYGGLRYYNRITSESGVADQFVRDLCERSQLAARSNRRP